MVRVTTEKVDKKKSLDVYPKEKIINALLESESQKEAIADGYSGILALFGPDMKAKWVNKATYVQFAEPIGKSCHEIFCAKNGTCDSCALRRSLETGAIESTTQHTGVFGDDGDEIIFDITSSPIIDKHG